MIEPSACGVCGIPKSRHYQQWKLPVGWHGYRHPTDQQILNRMHNRRESRQAMPKRGETLPYKVKFTYAADVAPGGVEVKGTRPFSDEGDALHAATELAQRGASVTVDKVVGTVTRHIVHMAPWTDAQRRLVELADEVTSLRDYPDEAQLTRMWEIRNEMAELATGIGVKRF